jgi:hypothetical protein
VRACAWETVPGDINYATDGTDCAPTVAVLWVSLDIIAFPAGWSTRCRLPSVYPAYRSVRSLSTHNHRDTLPDCPWNSRLRNLAEVTVRKLLAALLGVLILIGAPPLGFGW